MEHHAHSIWYVRKGNEVTGPFNAGIISQYILLGRIDLHDEVSEDRQVWHRVAEQPELIPEVMQADLSDPYNQERLQAAIRWADERREPHGMPPDKFGERRQHETAPDLQLREEREVVDTTVEVGKRRLRPLLLLLVSIMLVVYLALRYTPGPIIITSDCDAPPAAGVAWDNCHKPGVLAAGADLREAHIKNADLHNAKLSGVDLGASTLQYTNLSSADLSGASLRGASLVGALLRGADLSGANLEQADLAYADLQGANITGANLDGVRLGNAIWVDGTVCAPDSMGECKTKP